MAAEAAGAGYPLDVVAVAPGYVDSGNTPRWVGGGRFAAPRAVAEASLALLPTAAGHGTPVRPFWGDALLDLCVALLPERALGAMVYERHSRQRRKCLAQKA